MPFSLKYILNYSCVGTHSCRYCSLYIGVYIKQLLSHYLNPRFISSSYYTLRHCFFLWLRNACQQTAYEAVKFHYIAQQNLSNSEKELY